MPSSTGQTTSAPSTAPFVLFTVTCLWFFLEALVHYHIGKTGGLGISMPKGDELVKIVVSILICSGLSSGTVALIEKMMR